MANVIEIKTSEPIVTIRPCSVVFTADKTIAKGFVAYDDKGNRIFHYPIHSNPVTASISFLKEAINTAQTDFKEMMRRAYMEKKPVMLGQTLIHWYQYEFMLSNTDFYTGKPPRGRVIEMG